MTGAELLPEGATLSRSLVITIVLVAVVLTGCGGSSDDDSLGNAQPWCVFAGDFIDAVEEFSSLHRDGGTRNDSEEATESYWDAKRVLGEIEFLDGASHHAVQELHDAGSDLITAEEFRSYLGNNNLGRLGQRIEDIPVPDRYEERYETSKGRMDETEDTVRRICAS